MKRHVKLIFSALAAYVILLLLLVAAESHSTDATIRSFWDAVWFSLITMTTVGYGDLSPVTPLGRVLGLVFALCSIGILTALIGIGLRVLSSEFLPRLRLRFGRSRNWFFFSEDSEDAAALAASLRQKDQDCLLIFPAEGSGRVGSEKVLRMDWTAEDVKTLRGGTEGASLFFMGSDPWKNFTDALAACEAGLPCYCMADIHPEYQPKELHLFSPREAISRSYWKDHPLKKHESLVILIGCGETGSALLERALLTNVFENGRYVEYHVFDDTVNFAALHPEVVKALGSGQADEDSLVFHSESWMEARSRIQKADRIILCYDRDEDNLKAFETLKGWFVSSASVHIRLTERMDESCCFGDREQSMRPEFVMKDELNRRARLMNDIYNEGSSHPRSWEELSPFLRQSNIAAADHLIVKARCLLGDESLTELDAESMSKASACWNTLSAEQRDSLQKMEHRRWMRFHQMYNWSFAPVRDDALRHHPLILPYEELSAAEQAKDSYAWEMLGRLSEKQ